LSLVLFKLPIRPRLSLRTFVGNVILGLIMVVSGIALLGGGVLLLTRKPSQPPPNHEPQPRISIPEPPKRATAPQDQLPDEKGGRFERWVVKKFSREYFSIKEWRGDKYEDGFYAESSLNPDFEIEFHLGKLRETFAVECKWRKGFVQGRKRGLEWATERQIQNYQNYAQAKGIPVFVIIGVGGEPDDPDEIYLVKLEYLKLPYVTAEYLARFLRKNKGMDFYYDNKLHELR
jgi:hypothetical protein